MDIAFPQLLTVKEAANILRIDPSTVRRWVCEGVLDAVKFQGGGKRNRSVYRITLSSLEEKFASRDSSLASC